MKCFLFAFFLLLAQFGWMQSLDNAFYMPETDTLLWESPLSPRQVLSGGIAKIQVSQKKWQCSCRRCFGGCGEDSSKYSCIYRHQTRVYSYDAHGFPDKIVIEEYSYPKGVYEFRCINTYNKEGSLVKAQLFCPTGDSLFLINNIIREYNEKNLLSVSKIYIPAFCGSKYPPPTRLLKKREYTYNDQNCVMQRDDHTFSFDSSDEKRSHRFLYDTTNRLICYDGVPRKLFFYDKSGQDSGFYEVWGNHLSKRTTIVNLGSGATGSVVTTVMIDEASKTGRIGRELECVREIKDGKIFLWSYYYYGRRRRLTAFCTVLDAKTCFPVYTINNMWPLRRTKHHRSYFYSYFRCNRVKSPGKNFRIAFPPQANITEYTYTKR